MLLSGVLIVGGAVWLTMTCPPAVFMPPRPLRSEHNPAAKEGALK
jgi:hypothetical protein